LIVVAGGTGSAGGGNPFKGQILPSDLTRSHYLWVFFFLSSPVRQDLAVTDGRVRGLPS